MKKFYLQNFGCQMNEYDAARLSDLMLVKGFCKVEQPEDADLIILNTCAIREKAEEKIFSRIGCFRPLKQINQNLKIAVGGCVAVEQQTKIFQRAPEVDFVFGPATIHLLPDWYQSVHVVKVEGDPLTKFEHFPPPRLQGISAFISIMEGCNNFCSYCIVPFTRGREINRSAKSILQEIESLLVQGVKEIHLLGQNVNSYLDPESKMDLADLITEIASYSEVERIRFTTSYPKNFTDKLFEVYLKEPKLVNQLHLPIQSGSDRILKAMRRKYDTRGYIQIIDNLRKVRPDISLSSDFIVGFPGETEQEFNETLALVETLKFDHSFSFIFSKRPGTKAADLPDPVPIQEKKQRLVLLQRKLANQTQQYSNLMLNTVQTVLVEQKRNLRGQCTGRTENNRVVNFLADDRCLGNLTKVMITEVLPNSLRGQPVVNND